LVLLYEWMAKYDAHRHFISKF